MQQLGEISEYISAESPARAEKLVNRIVSRLRQVTTFPLSGRSVPEWKDPDVRELLEPPYRLIYRIRADAVEVIAIVHERRRSRRAWS